MNELVRCSKCGAETWTGEHECRPDTQDWQPKAALSPATGNCSAKDAEIERLRAELAAAKRLAADALAAKDKAERESKKWMERWEEVCERS